MDKILCQEIKPPTSVTHSVFARFTGYDRINLCVVKNTVLDIYAIVDQEDDYKVSRRLYETELNSMEDEEDMPAPRFRLRHSFKLFGNVQTINTIRFADLEANAIGEPHGFDGLFLTFPNSKCSLVAYDPIKHNLRTLALHHLAEDAEGYGADVKLAYTENNDRADRSGISIASVDPLNRCIAILGNDDQLVIIPFLQGGIAPSQGIRSPKRSKGKSPASSPSSSTTTKTTTTTSRKSSPKAKGGINTGSENNNNTNNNNKNDNNIIYNNVKTVRSPLVLKPYIVQIGKGRANSNNGSVVKSMTFLHGYFEPTLLLLQENVLRTWTGSLSNLTNTCNLFALSLNLQHEQSPCIWNIKNLPYDSHHVLAVPRPLGGALILSSNAVIYFSQNNRCGIATNGFAVTTVDKTLCNIEPNNKRYRLVLNAETQCIFLDNTCALITADNGDLYLLHLIVIADAVTKLNLVRTGANANIASSIASWSYNSSERLLLETKDSKDEVTTGEANGKNLNSGILFLGSWLGDSLLLKYKEILDANLKGENDVFLSPKLSQSSRKRPRTTDDNSTNNSSKKSKTGGTMNDNEMNEDSDDDSDDDDDDDDFLYGEGNNNNNDDDDDDDAAKSNSTGALKSGKSGKQQNKVYQFLPCDVLVNLGPITSIAIDEKTKRENNMAYDELRNRGEEIICSSGYRTNSGLTTLHASMELFEQMAFVLKGGKCKGSWALKVQLGENNDDDEDDDEGYDNLLLLSVGKQTKVISFANGSMKPLTEKTTTFVLDEDTIMSGTLLNGTVAVQVLRNRVLLYWMDGSDEPGKAMKSSEINLSPSKKQPCEITHVTISDPHILIYTSDENMHLLMPKNIPGKFEKNTISANKRKDINVSNSKTLCMRIFSDKNIVDHSKNTLMAPPFARPPPPLLSKNRMKGLRRSKAINFDLMGNNEEDDILYGDEDDDDDDDDSQMNIDNDDSNVNSGQKVAIERQLKVLELQKTVKSQDRVQPYILACYENGTLEITNLPDKQSPFGESIKLLFQSIDAANGAELLVDRRRKLTRMAQKLLDKGNKNNDDGEDDKKIVKKKRNTSDAGGLGTSNTSTVVDVMIAYVGPLEQEEDLDEDTITNKSYYKNEGTCVLTMVLESGDVLVYQRHPQPSMIYEDADGNDSNDVLPLAFVRVKHSIVTRPPRNHGKKKDRKKDRFEESSSVVSSKSILTYCSGVADHSMIYCNTYRPVWVTTEQGHICVYAASLPSSSYLARQQKSQNENGDNNKPMKKYYNPTIVSMTPLNIEQCDKGLLLVHSNGNAIMCEMANRTNDDVRIGSDGAFTNILSGQKLVLGENIRKILPLPHHLYNAPNVYAAITSKPVPGITLKVIDEDLEKAAMIAAQELGEPYEPREKRPQYVKDEDLDELGGAPSTEDEQFFVKIIQIIDEEEDDNEDDDDEMDDDIDGKQIKVLHEYTLESNEYGMCLQYSTVYDAGEEYMKTFLFVGTGFVKPQGNDLHGYGRVLALKPTATGLVLHYKMATAGGVTGIQSLRSKTVLDKLRVKTPAELRKEAEEKKAKQKKSTGQISDSLGAVATHEKMTNEQLAKTKGGTLLIASERRLTLYEIRRGRLLCIGFYDMKVTAVNVKVIKNYVLVADIYHSLQFLRWKPHQGELELLGWDPYHNTIHNTNVYTSGFMITSSGAKNSNVKNNSLGLLMTNNKNDIIVMEYDPEANRVTGEYTKQPLKSVSEIRLGSIVSVLHKRRMIGGAMTSRQKLKSLANNYIYGSLYGTLDGSIGILAPILDEKMYRRLLTLQSVLTNALEHHCGLNPREFRYTRSKFTSNNSRPMCNRMLDLTLLMQYICLNIPLQRELARSVGSNRDMIMENLRSLAESLKM